MPTAPVSLMPALRRVIAGRTADRTDADLLAAFVDDRDAEAFAALVRRHGPMVLGVCRRVVRDPDAADDAFQAVFLVLARRAAEVRPRNRVGAWLYGVAYRTALKARAVRARRRTRESQVDAMPEPAAPPAADGWDDLKPVLDEELARLPDRLRVPVVLCDLEGRPQRAVAGQLGIAPATLAGRLADARKALAARLTRRGVALSAAALAAILPERASAGVVNPQLAAGVVRAAEAVAAGGAAAGLVSANALQLCDGVMRMIFLTKLKAAASAVAVVLALAGGVGPGLVPAAARDAAEPDAPAARARGADTDAAFLDRVCVEFRGSKGTAVEHVYFAADKDADKRRKVTRWLLDGPAAPATAGRLAEVVDLFTTVGEVDTGLALTVDGKRVTTGSADAASAEVRARIVRAYEAAQPLAEPTVQWADLAKSLAARQKAEPGKRVEVVVEKSKDAKAPAPGEPVRVKVVTVTDDGKGGVKYKVEEVLKYKGAEVPADPAKKAVGQAPAVQGYRLELVAPADGKGGAPQSFLYRLIEDDKLLEGDAIQTLRLKQALPPGKGEPGKDGVRAVVWPATSADTDAAFLRRAVTEARGTPPTALEERYFAADPDPKKREKLLDALLADPTALRRVGDGWKRRMLAPPAAPQPQAVPYTPKGVLESKRSDLFVQPKFEVVPYPPVPPTAEVRPFLYTQPKGTAELRDYLVVPRSAPDPAKPKAVTPPTPPTPPAPPAAPKAVTPIPPTPATPLFRPVTRTAPAADRWARLVGELIAAGKSDEQILEALTLAAAGRLPTDVERRLALAVLPTSGDRAAGWSAVARALSGPTPPPAPPAPPPLPKSRQ